MTNPKTTWDPKDWTRAKTLRDSGMTIPEIAEELDIDERRVHGKFTAEGYRTRRDTGTIRRTKEPSPAAEASRASRHIARLNQNTTGFIMGDPPPGFSALDKRRQKESTP